tara:strand:+ start:4642 stop:5196 length:555 start_codon:yes stop_codon:yes gene_type:complete
MGSIATKEPEKFTAGDSVTWKKSLADYPAPLWVLTYSMRGTAGAIDFTATADELDHLIELSAATSSAFESGIYDVQGYATKGSERATVFTGKMEVVANLAAEGSSYDGRSHVKRTLDNIEAVIEKRASKEILESNVAGVALKRISHVELLELREKYLAYYRQEQSAEKLKGGKQSGMNILSRFK